MDTPPSASIHEEATVSVAVPFMVLFNNLVMFDQHVANNSFDSIVPDLATRWTWSDDGKQLAFTLRQGVRWHDGKPFTARTCAAPSTCCSSRDKLRRNPRAAWYEQRREGDGDGDFVATFHLKHRSRRCWRCSPPAIRRSIPATFRRRHAAQPVGTGPFKLVEFKMNEGIKLARNADYWKPGRPYLDGIEYTIIPDRSTRMLAFASGQFDMTFPTDVSVPLRRISPRTRRRRTAPCGRPASAPTSSSTATGRRSTIRRSAARWR